MVVAQAEAIRLLIRGTNRTEGSARTPNAQIDVERVNELEVDGVLRHPSRRNQQSCRGPY